MKSKNKSHSETIKKFGERGKIAAKGGNGPENDVCLLCLVFKCNLYH